MNNTAAMVDEFEQLCRDAQVPATRAAAELKLQSLRARDDAVPCSMSLIENVRSSQARFHAAEMLRASVITRWRSLPPKQRTELRIWAVRAVAARQGIAPYERRAVLRAAATFFRRAYAEESKQESEEFLTHLAHAAKTQPVIAALECMDMCVEEFISCSKRRITSTVEIEMFRRARPQFLAGNGHVVYCFRMAKESLHMIIERAQHMQACDFEACCTPALALLTRVLSPKLINWKLDNDSADDDKNSNQTAELSSVLRLDSSWLPLVEQLHEVAELSFKIIETARKYPPDLIEELADNARQVILGVSAVARASYSSLQMAASVAKLILSTVQAQSWATSEDRTERLAYSEVWRQLACSHRLEGLTVFGTEIFETFAQKTCNHFHVVAVEQVQASQDDLVSVMDGADLLLETWAAFSYDPCANDPNVRSVLQPLFERVFVEFVQLSMKSMHAERLPPGSSIGGIADDLDEEDLGFDDTSAEESRLNSAAALARFSLQNCSAVLVQCAQDLADRVFFRRDTSSSVKATISTLAQEDLYFLVHLLAAVLADADAGEVPAVPFALRTDMAANTNDLSKTAGHKLFAGLIEVATKETNLLQKKGAHCDEASPRVGQAMLSALDRVAPTYIVPEESDSAFDVIGGEQFATQARAYALNKALEGVSGRGFDPEMAESAAKLLKTLASAAKKYGDVQTSTVWSGLLSTGIEAYQTLAPGAVENIGAALTCVLNDVDVANRLVVPAVQSIPALIARQNELPDVAERCIACITLLKGVARCSELGPSSFQGLSEVLGDYKGSLTHIVSLFQPERYDVARVAISLADDLLRDRLALLNEIDAVKLLAKAMNLVHTHATSIAVHAKAVPFDECVLGVESILVLLQHVVDERPPMAASDHLFRGLAALLPCMTDAFLVYPAVKKGYFDFVTSVVAHYPGAVIRLPTDIGSKVFASLRLELFSGDTRAELKGLEAVSALAREVTASPSQNAETELGHLLQAIVVSVAHGIAFTENMEAASESILQLLFVKGPENVPSYFEVIGRKLVEQGGGSQEMVDIVSKLRERASAAGYGEKREPAVRRAAAKEFKDAVLEFSVRCRDIMLRV